jgi:hypothetical protein
MINAEEQKGKVIINTEKKTKSAPRTLEAHHYTTS